MESGIPSIEWYCSGLGPRCVKGLHRRGFSVFSAGVLPRRLSLLEPKRGALYTVFQFRCLTDYVAQTWGARMSSQRRHKNAEIATNDAMFRGFKCGAIEGLICLPKTAVASNFRSFSTVREPLIAKTSRLNYTSNHIQPPGVVRSRLQLGADWSMIHDTFSTRHQGPGPTEEYKARV